MLTLPEFAKEYDYELTLFHGRDGPDIDWDTWIAQEYERYKLNPENYQLTYVD